MKLFIVTTLFSIITLCSCKVTQEQAYKNYSQETCDCINLFTNDLSPGMIKVITASEGVQEKLEEKMMEYMMTNREEGIKDTEILQDQERMELMTECMSKVEEKNEGILPGLSDDEKIEKMIQQLKGMEGCKCAAAVLQLGNNAE